MVNSETGEELVAHAKEFLLKQIHAAELELRTLDIIFAVNPTDAIRANRAEKQLHLEQLQTQLGDFNGKH